jgi:hypothetical protein
MVHRGCKIVAPDAVRILHSRDDIEESGGIGQ